MDEKLLGIPGYLNIFQEYQRTLLLPVPHASSSDKTQHAILLTPFITVSIRGSCSQEFSRRGVKDSTIHCQAVSLESRAMCSLGRR